MRTIEEIKKSMLDDFYKQPGMALKFNSTVSNAGILSVLFYVFAAVVWSMESLFYLHKGDVETYINEFKPHTLRWYRNKVLDYRAGKELIPETDQYDLSLFSEEELASTRVVKYCAVTEAVDASVLYIKVAGETSGKRGILSTDHENGLRAYMQVVKDAGVKIVIKNQAADNLKLELKIYYNPLILNENGERIDGRKNKPVQETITNYIENLPFNGEYKNVELVDVLQKVNGVVIPELLSSSARFGENAFTDIEALLKPDAGYFTLNEEEDLTIKWEAYNASDL